MDELRVIEPAQPIREVVYQQLKDAVMAGVFKAGERLLEHDIAERLQVSRTPVREALRRLESEGLLEALPKQGLVVKSYTDDEIREIYMIREALECLAAEFASINATEEEIVMLEKYVEEMDKLDDDASAEEAMGAHRRFSEAYNRASHMPTLVRLIESLKEQVTRFRGVSLSGAERRFTAREEHRELLDALKQRDPERASALTHIHIRGALTAYFNSKKENGGGSEVN